MDLRFQYSKEQNNIVFVAFMCFFLIFEKCIDLSVCGENQFL